MKDSFDIYIRNGDPTAPVLEQSPRHQGLCVKPPAPPGDTGLRHADRDVTQRCDRVANRLTLAGPVNCLLIVCHRKSVIQTGTSFDREDMVKI